MNNQIENIVRAVIIKDEKILTCLAKESGHYFLPGGHIEFGEDATTALNRELEEELGVNLVSSNFIGILENFYGTKDKKHHEYCVVFQGELSGYSIKSKENHIDFVWMTKEELRGANFLPSHFKQSLLKWLNNKEMFFSTGVI